MKLPSIDIKTFFDKKLIQDLLFVLVMLVASWYYNYHEIVEYRPTSKHQWRNAVSASIALNYCHEGEFCHPRTHNMQVDNFTSDITITEFPVVYYFIGMLYRLFGFHEWIYKLVQILIGFTGLYFLFRLGIKLFDNTLYALLLPLIIFSSPIYVYYLNNFIPDAPSLSIALAGLYFFYLYYQNGKNRYLLFSIMIFSLAGLLKAPALLVYFALLAIFFLENIFQIRFKTEAKIFKQWPVQLIILGSTLVLVFAWYAYAKIYTDIHGGVVSLVEIRPFWILDQETIKTTWEVIKNRFWEGQYHSPYFLILTAALLVFNLVAWKKHSRFFSWLVVLTLLGGISFSLLFYRSLKDHDYYQINNLVVLVLIVINFLLYLKNNHLRIYEHWISKISLIIGVLLLIISCNTLMSTHYYNGWFEWHARKQHNNKYNEITPYLRSLGIERENKVYCTPDPSINISLYLMDQKGFTDFYRSKFPFSEKLEFYSDHGLQYVVVGDSAAMDISPAEAGLKWIGEFNTATIFRVTK
ncbi:MAG: glycosyltransferase family 39 protein [Bacteroidales bacterium]|nr:glycosyltransferase family 39 protein [Bacteroidales bacterium]